jgi:hypothetical protein
MPETQADRRPLFIRSREWARQRPPGTAMQSCARLLALGNGTRFVGSARSLWLGRLGSQRDLQQSRSRLTARD